MVSSPKIAVIADFPTLEEVGSPFSGAASMHLKTSLRKAFSFTEHPLITRNIHYLYLSQNRLQQGLETEVFSSKELPLEVRHNFHELTYLKDTFISDYLNDNLNKLISDLQEIKPDIVVLSGKWSFYFLACYIDSDLPPGRLSSVKSGKRGINYFGLNVKFRGSIMTMYKEHGIPDVICLPIIPHAYQAMTSAGVAITTDYFKLAYLNTSLASGVSKSRWLDYKPNTQVYDTFPEAKAFLENLLNLLENSILDVSVDLETTAKTIDTIGIAYNNLEGHAIPFLKGVDQRVNKYKDTAYDSKGKPVTCFLGSKIRTYERVFSLYEEAELVFLITKILNHGNIRVVGQNYHYDGLFLKEVWLTESHAHIDTMGLAHVLRNNEKKGLAYLCSLHLEHYAYWKDDLNAKDSSLRWHYCAKDAVFTLQLKEALVPYLEALPEKNQQYYWNKQQRTAKHVLKRMFSGLSIDVKMREQLDLEFTAFYENAIEQIQLLVGYELNIRSTPQIRALLIDCLGITPILDRKRKTPTFGNAAMLKYVAKYPKYAYLLFLILEAKSIATYLQNFMRARLDDKNQLRSFIGVFGTKSYRFNSRKFLSGLGGNVMNWSTGDKISLVYSSLALEHQDYEESDYGYEDNEEEDVEVLALAQQESKLAKAPNSKQIVIPSSPEKFFVNVDLKAGDLHLVAWMANAYWVKEILLSGGDVYTVLGSEYYGTTLLKSDPRRQKFKMVCHACVTEDHEVLTPRGWIYISDLTLEDSLAVWNTDFSVHFEKPSYINKDFVSAEEDLYSIEGTSFSFLGTQDHKFPATTDKASNIRKYEASKLPKSARIPYSGFLQNKTAGFNYEADFVRLIVALQADGSVSRIDREGKGHFVFRFAKLRKINRLESILKALNINYLIEETSEVTTKNNPIYKISFKGGLAPEFKKLDWYILNWSLANLEVFVDELKHWDGCLWEHKEFSTRREEVSTIDKKAAEIIHTAVHLVGKASKLLVVDKPNKSRLYVVSINNRNFFNLSTCKVKKPIKHNGTMVYCPQVSTGYFLFRRNGHIAVSGNTNYLGMPKTIAMQTGLAEIEVLRIMDFYFTKNPEIVSNYQNKIINDCLTLGYTENPFGARYQCSTTDEMVDKTWRQKMVALPAQGGVADWINEVMDRADEQEPFQKYPMVSKLQIHDAGLWEVDKRDKDWKDRIDEYFKVELAFPYPNGKTDILTIPWDISQSEINYAKCK